MTLKRHVLADHSPVFLLFEAIDMKRSTSLVFLHARKSWQKPDVTSLSRSLLTGWGLY